MLQLSVSSIIHPLEVAVFVTNGYNYYPNILPAGADYFMGAFVSNVLFVPASAVFINVFSLSWWSVLFIAAGITGIDWYFTVLGIYQHFWWKSIYTGVGLLVLYAISRWYWHGLSKDWPGVFFRLLVIYLTYFAIQGIIIFAANRGGQLFTLKMACIPLADSSQMLSLVFSIYQYIASIVAALCIGLRMPFYCRILGIVIIAGMNWAIGYFGIFVSYMNITPNHLILAYLAAIPLLWLLFRAAKLDYLFPKYR